MQGFTFALYELFFLKQDNLQELERLGFVRVLRFLLLRRVMSSTSVFLRRSTAGFMRLNRRSIGRLAIIECCSSHAIRLFRNFLRRVLQARVRIINQLIRGRRIRQLRRRLGRDRAATFAS